MSKKVSIPYMGNEASHQRYYKSRIKKVSIPYMGNEEVLYERN